MEIKIGHKFKSTLGNKSVEVLDIFLKKRRNGDIDTILVVAIIRNKLPSIQYWKLKKVECTLLDKELYEKF
jgi:hypothetical protein